MSSLPIACTLSAPDLAAVKERYRMAAGQYQATARIIGNTAVISLSGERAFLQALLDEMVERESACCAFLTIGVTSTQTGFDVELGLSEPIDLATGLLNESVMTLFPAARIDDRG